jgi:zinc/manganese transport system permease protein
MINYLSYSFAQHALIATTLIALLTGLISPLIIGRKMAFAVHGTSELAFTGAVAGLMVLNNPVVGALVGAVILAVLISSLGEKKEERDSNIGVVLAFGLAIGVLLLSFYQGFATAATNILFGNIFGVSISEIIILVLLAVVSITVVTIIFRPLVFASLDANVALASGVNVKLLGYLFLLILSLTATEAAQIVGTLLVLSLTITPGAAAVRFANSLGATLLVSIIASLFSADLGLLLSLQFSNLKPSVLIAMISFAIYISSRIYEKYRNHKEQLKLNRDPTTTLNE